MSSWRVRCPLSSHMLLTLSASSWRYDLIVWILFDILNFIHFFKLTSDVWYLNAQRVLHVLSACVRSAVTPIWVTLCEWKRSLASPSSSSWRVRWVIHQLFKYLPYVCVCMWSCRAYENLMGLSKDMTACLVFSWHQTDSHPKKSNENNSQIKVNTVLTHFIMCSLVIIIYRI